MEVPPSLQPIITGPAVARSSRMAKYISRLSCRGRGEDEKSGVSQRRAAAAAAALACTAPAAGAGATTLPALARPAAQLPPQVHPAAAPQPRRAAPRHANLHLGRHVQCVDRLALGTRLLGHQRSPQHLLGQCRRVGGLADVHAALRAAGPAGSGARRRRIRRPAAPHAAAQEPALAQRPPWPAPTLRPLVKVPRPRPPARIWLFSTIRPSLSFIFWAAGATCGRGQRGQSGDPPRLAGNQQLLSGAATAAGPPVAAGAPSHCLRRALRRPQLPRWPAPLLPPMNKQP